MRFNYRHYVKASSSVTLEKLCDVTDGGLQRRRRCRDTLPSWHGDALMCCGFVNARRLPAWMGPSGGTRRKVTGSQPAASRRRRSDGASLSVFCTAVGSDRPENQGPSGWKQLAGARLFLFAVLVCCLT